MTQNIARIALSTLAFWLITWNYCFAKHPIYKSIGINEGLPSSSTYYVLNDKQGYIWIAGDLGLSKFDGRNIKSIPSLTDEYSQSVLCLDQDADGRVYMISAQGSIGFVLNDKIIEFPASKELKSILKKTKSFVTAFVVDNKKNIWIATSTGLLNVPNKYEYKKIIPFKSQDPNCYALLKDFGKKNIFSVNSNKRNAVGIAQKAISVELQLNHASVSELVKINSNEGFNPRFTSLKARNNKTYFSILNELFLYENEQIKKLQKLPSTVLFLFEDCDQNLYVSLSNNQGVLLFKKGNLQQQPDTFFKGASIGSIAQDFERGIWLTSTNKGVFYIPYLYSYFFNELPLLNEPITAVTTIDNNIYVGTYDHRVLKLDYSENIQISKPLIQLTNIGDVSIKEVKNRLFYCGTNTAIFNEKSLVSKVLNHATSSLPSYDITSFQDKIILLSYGSLLEVDKDVTHEFLSLTRRGNCILSFQNQLLIGTKEGLLQFDGKQLIEAYPNVLSDKNIMCMASNTKGDIYLGTKNHGLYKIAKGNIYNINKNAGIESSYIRKIFIDKNDNVWLATNNGVIYIEPKRSIVLNKEHGLNTNEIEALTIRDKELFVATKTGLVEYGLVQLNQMMNESKINLESVQVNDSISVHRIFEYDENNIRFNISSISYKNLFKQFFHYQLKGFDTEMKSTTNNYIEYSHLPPGKYTLILAGNTLKPNQNKEYFSFEILPPFWSTWWFIFLCVTTFFMIAVVITKWRLTIQKKQLIENVKINKLIAESQITAIRAQMNPHFIFNSINSIQDFVLKNDTQNAYDYLARFAKLIRLVLNNSRKNYISLEKELEWLNVYVSLEQLRFKNKFEFTLKIDDEIYENSDIKIPTMLIQPYIENAIWHGLMPMQDSRQGSLLLQMKFDDHELKIIIEDNGIGRKTSQKNKEQEIHHSMGMKLINEKIEALMRLEKNDVKVQISDLFEGEKPMGTRVVIIIHY